MVFGAKVLRYGTPAAAFSSCRLFPRNLVGQKYRTDRMRRGYYRKKHFRRIEENKENHIVPEEGSVSESLSLSDGVRNQKHNIMQQRKTALRKKKITICLIKLATDLPRRLRDG